MASGESLLTKLPPLAKVGVALGLLLLVAGAYFVVFYGEVSSAIDAAQTQDRKLRADLAEARREQYAYQEDLKELKKREQRQNELVKILPTNTEAPQFLSSLQSAANEAGATLLAWTPQPEVPDQFYARIPMRLELQGRFHQLAKFFYNVGQLDRIMNMENISITEPKTQGSDVTIRAEVLATAFRALKEGTGAPDPSRGRTPAKTGAP